MCYLAIRRNLLSEEHVGALRNEACVVCRGLELEVAAPVALVVATLGDKEIRHGREGAQGAGE
jgi:hypothetical protein